jgi:hypothetical protein
VRGHGDAAVPGDPDRRRDQPLSARRTCTSCSTFPGYEPLITHLFEEGADYLDSDVVFGVKEDLVARNEKRERGPTPTVAGSTLPWCAPTTTSCSSRRDDFFPPRPSSLHRDGAGEDAMSGAEKQGPLDAEFTATLVRSEAEGGWTYVQMPGSAE